MQNELTPQKMKVQIEEVNPQSNEVYINDGQGNEGYFPVKAPANIKWIKTGECDITMANGAIVYARNTAQAPRQNNFGGYKKPYQPQNGFKKFPAPSSPVRADEYQEEKKESKRIGMTKAVKDISLQEISLMYNSLSMSNKWIVATNIFPRPNGNYDCIFFISEERDGFDPTPYVAVEDTDIDGDPVGHKSDIKVKSEGTF